MKGMLSVAFNAGNTSGLNFTIFDCLSKYSTLQLHIMIESNSIHQQNQALAAYNEEEILVL
jgi:hypothetical protein